MRLQLHLVYVRDFGDAGWFLSAVETDFAKVVAHHEKMLAKHPLVKVESIRKEDIQTLKCLKSATKSPTRKGRGVRGRIEGKKVEARR